jgi:hypothetical protein
MSSQMDDDPIVPTPTDRPNDGDYLTRLAANVRLVEAAIPIGDLGPPMTTTEVLESLDALRRARRRTGVIVGVNDRITAEDSVEIRNRLRVTFPSVEFAVMSDVGSVAFEWDADE